MRGDDPQHAHHPGQGAFTDLRELHAAELAEAGAADLELF